TNDRYRPDRLHPLRRTESDRDLPYLIRTLFRFLAQPERGLSSPTSSATACREKPGRVDCASRILRDEVCNRSDDGNPPLELSERTEIRRLSTASFWSPLVAR